jgi:ubiquinone/menaquinone biosynthesis C-methylase UbiE
MLGCGPGTITVGFVKYASEGRTIGIDIPANVSSRAKAAADEASILEEGLGSVVFKEGNILEGLAYPDNTFDVVGPPSGSFPPSRHCK